MGVQGVQNVPRSALVKTNVASRRISTDVAFAVLLAASIFTHTLRGTFGIPCTQGRIIAEDNEDMFSAPSP
jgi:hypothetical protein